MKIINCDDVRATAFGFKDKLPETLEEVFVWNFHDHNGVKPDSLSERAKINLDFINFYFNGAMYDLGIWHTFPNGVVCKSTNNKGEREEVTYNNVFEYYPMLSTQYLCFCAKHLKEGSLGDVFNMFKVRFKELSGEDFVALSDDELLVRLKHGIENFNSDQKINTPKLVLKVDQDKSFSCYLDDSDVIEIPSGVCLDYHKMKQEKKSLQEYPNKYLSKKVLAFAISKHIINTWEYKFYMDILSKPKPRKLSKRQSEMYKNINTKIKIAL